MSSAPAPTPEKIIAALQPYSTCDIADALVKLNKLHQHQYSTSAADVVPPCGGFLPGLSMYSPERQAGPTKIVGAVYTVGYVFKDQAAKGESVREGKGDVGGGGGGGQEGHYVRVGCGFGSGQIDSLPPSSILFISGPPSSSSGSTVHNALLGGLLATRAQYLGIKGVIVDGRIRDLEELRELRIPVFARDVGTTSPQEILKVGSINHPVTFHLQFPSSTHHQQTTSPTPTTTTTTTTISPNDYLIADLNGVIHLPKTLALEIINLNLIAPAVAADKLVAQDLKRGVGFAEALRVRRG